MTDDIAKRRQEQIEERIKAMTGPNNTGASVIIEGRAVPRLTMHDNGSEISLVLDGRLSFPFPREIAAHAAEFAANAMAIGAGYPSIQYCDKPSPFAPQCMEWQPSGGRK